MLRILTAATKCQQHAQPTSCCGTRLLEHVRCLQGIKQGQMDTQISVTHLAAGPRVRRCARPRGAYYCNSRTCLLLISGSIDPCVKGNRAMQHQGAAGHPGRTRQQQHHWHYGVSHKCVLQVLVKNFGGAVVGKNPRGRKAGGYSLPWGGGSQRRLAAPAEINRSLRSSDVKEDVRTAVKR